jgi:hypothetical protein
VDASDSANDLKSQATAISDGIAAMHREQLRARCRSHPHADSSGRRDDKAHLAPDAVEQPPARDVDNLVPLKLEVAPRDLLEVAPSRDQEPC